jgi:hypothetical protein
MPPVEPARAAIVLAKTLRVATEAARAVRALRIIFLLLHRVPAMRRLVGLWRPVQAIMPPVEPARAAIVLAKTLRVATVAARAVRALRIIVLLLQVPARRRSIGLWRSVQAIMPPVEPARAAIVLAKTLRVMTEAARAVRALRIIFLLLHLPGEIAGVRSF